jgi:nucleolar GTP-binding protein
VEYDIIPEIMDGHNIVDFVDPDIDRRLAELEKEEGLLLAEASLRDDEQVLSKWRDTQDTLDELHSRMRQRRLVNKLRKGKNNHAPVTRKTKGAKKGSEVEEDLNAMGLPGAKVRGRSSSVKRDMLGKRKREASIGSEGEAASVAARARSQSLMKGLPSMEVAEKVEKKRRKQLKERHKQGRKGEGDRWVPDLKPKHLYSGKRGIGKTDRR